MTNINTNVGALNALKALEQTDKAMSQAMARLSSGLKINSAADDAAGSALASKMEASVRSLEVAIRNSEDAISMTQTAEGALGQVENILQRIRELAVQAGNSTLSSNDRTMIQNEVNQLTKKIDSIAKTTDFNGVQLLDGSNQQVSFQVGTHKVDNLTIDLQASDATTLGLGGTIGVKTLTSGRVPATDHSSAAIATSDIKINGEDAFASNYAEDSSGTEVDAAGALALAINLNTGTHGAVADAFNVVTSKAKGDFNMTTTFQINSNTVALASSYSELVSNINESVSGIDAGLNADNTITLSNNDGDQILISNTTGTTDVGFTQGTYRGFVSLTNIDGSAVTIEAGNAKNGYGSTAAGTHTDVEAIGFMENTKNVLETGIVTTTVLTETHDIKINDVKIGASTTDSAGSKADAINKLTSDHGVTADAETELTIAVDFTNIAGATDVTLNGNTVDLSGDKNLADVVGAFNDAQIGDIRAVGNSDGTLTLNSESGVNIVLKDVGSGTATNAMFATATDIHGESISVATDTYTAFGNLTLTSSDASPIKVSGDDVSHIGTLQQSQELKVTGSGIAVDSMVNATNSLSKIDAAIEKVSLQRSSFGAVENRIEASMNNLTTLKVNTEASLSRIVDANFAEETSNLTKNQILNQAATSMLAQANASKQNLLALLQG